MSQPERIDTEPTYASSPDPGTFRAGVEFQDFVCLQLAKDHVILQNLSSKKYQFAIGENLQGFEIKLDRVWPSSKRLSIEIAEKAHAANTNWVPSGIYRDDNSWLYIQGNYEKFWVFSKNILRMWHKKHGTGSECSAHGTVRKFYVPIDVADTIAAKVVVVAP